VKREPRHDETTLAAAFGLGQFGEFLVEKLVSQPHDLFLRLEDVPARQVGNSQLLDPWQTKQGDRLRRHLFATKRRAAAVSRRRS
jgi:hypothetical protein